jgi:hypothetical protein
VATLTKPNQTKLNRKGKKVKTTLTQKLDNWLEKTSGMITLLSAIGVFVGGLFALSLAHDYNLGTGNAFGIVIFLVFFGVCLGGMGTWVFVEKVGEQNTANTAKHLHAYYRNELDKVRVALHADKNADTGALVAQADYLSRELFRVRELAETQETEIDALERDLVKTEQRKQFAIRDMETAERQRDGYRSLCDTNELLKNALRETHARQVGELVADLAWARELLARDGRDLVEHELADKYAQENFTR